MELLGSAQKISPFVAAESEAEWSHVVDSLPEDHVPVEVKMARTDEIIIAWRGHYQSTGAWFDAKTRVPIYETIVHWRALR